LKRFHQLLKSHAIFREQIEGLVMDEPVIIKLDQGMTYSSLVAFLHLFRVNASYHVRVTEMSVRQLWTLLYSAGYLTTRMVIHLFVF
jgi:hypothetical protein